MHHFVECHQKVRPALDDLELSMEHRGNDRMNSIGSRRGVQIRFCCCSTVVYCCLGGGEHAYLNIIIINFFFFVKIHHEKVIF